jgi:hypothetical protein
MDAEAGEFEAVKELERLRAERDRLEKQLALEQQVSAALREGLKPFANIARLIPGNWPARCRLTWVNSGPYEIIITYFAENDPTTAPPIACYRRAAELLASTEGGS